MSIYDEDMDDNEVVCPYCAASYQPEGEDFSEDTREIECFDCGKKFYTYDSVTITHHMIPDCELNGEEHQWEAFTFKDGDSHDFCSVCSKCRPLDNIKNF